MAVLREWVECQIAAIAKDVSDRLAKLEGKHE
jgi:hypothetical protein